MTSPRRDKYGNILAPKRLAKAGNKPVSVRPTSTSERKAIAAGLKKLPTRKKGASKKLQTATPLKGLDKAAKTAIKKNKQLSGFQAIAKRKEARAKAAGKTYDMAKSNPRLAKKIAGKKAAIAKTGVMIEPVLKNPPKKRRGPAPMPQASFGQGEMKGPIGKIRKLKPGKAGIGLSPVKRKKNNKKVRKISNKGNVVLF